MKVTTRFAPSPTGYLHIGSARTALFNYLFTRHYSGKFLLRIEDTDKSRSTQEATDEIFKSLSWLGIDWDGDVVYQSSRIERHKEVVYQLVKEGKAYFCHTLQDEIVKLRNEAYANKKHFIFNSPWRNRSIQENLELIGANSNAVIRLKSPRDGNVIVHDKLLGDITIQCDSIDDMVLLRSDGTPTYMLSVVVDDHDMGITHIIRGDDHLNNASKQQVIYKMMGWEVPAMVHIPLIHGPDGNKLSKRHGALGVSEYKKMGYLPEALSNYLLRLGWSHGDDEIINSNDAIKYFDIDGLGKSPAKINFDKMQNLNAHYIREMNNGELIKKIQYHLEKYYLGRALDNNSLRALSLAIAHIKSRVKLLNELYELSLLYMSNIPLKITDDVKSIISEFDNNVIESVIKTLTELKNFNQENIKLCLKECASLNDMKFSDLMRIIRGCMTGMFSSPGIFSMMEIIGKQESIKRLQLYKSPIS